MKDILNLPLNKKYTILLSDLRFDYVSFKDEKQVYDHHYASVLEYFNEPYSQTQLCRLAQEFADLSNALPIDHTNSIFVRCDTEKRNMIKSMIMG